MNSVEVQAKVSATPKVNYKNLSTLTEQTDRHDIDINKLKGDVSTAQEDIAALQEDVDTIDQQVDTMEGNVQNHATRLNTAETKISTLETNVSNLDAWLDDVAGDVSDHTTRLATAETHINSLISGVDNIEGKIPSEASSSNKLADKNFVNSSIATNTATFQGTYRLHDDLGVLVVQSDPDSPIEYDKSATANALAQQISSADNNDYCFVVVPVSNTTGADTAYIDRFKYNGTAWSYEYTLNNSGFTAEQWAVINSGVAFEKGTGANSVKLKGDSNTASGEGAVTFGRNRSTAAGIRSFSHGDGAFANANFSHAEGQNAVANGESSHAEGFQTVASGQWSHAEGISTSASTQGAHAEGGNTYASGECSHAEGGGTRAHYRHSHAEGDDTTAGGESSHAEGVGSNTRSTGSHTEGFNTKALEGSNYSHAEGNKSNTKGYYSHAEGSESYTIGSNSHAEGVKTTTIGSGSHSEGEGTGITRLGQIPNNPADHTAFRMDNPVQVYKGDIVSNDSAFLLNKAIVTEDSYGIAVHVDHHGYKQADIIYIVRGISSGTGSHSEGKDTKASGDYSHAEGNLTYTEGQYSHAEGIHTEATNTGEHAAGKYNKSNQGTIHSVGVGTSVDDRKNAWEIDESGNVYIKDIGGYDGTNPSTSTSLQTEYAANKGKVDLMFPSAPYVDGGNYPFEYNITTADDRYIYAYIDASSLYAYLENNAPATLNVNFKGVDYTLPVAKDTTDNHWYIGENISSVSDILSTNPITIVAFPTGGSDSFIKIKDEEGTALTEYFIGVGDFIENIHKVQDKFLPDTLVHSSHIDKIIVLSQAEFNALTSYEPNTQYEIYA